VSTGYTTKPSWITTKGIGKIVIIVKKGLRCALYVVKLK
jgi:hypothetical protein